MFLSDLNEVKVVAILELILAIYSVDLFIRADKKVLKVIHLLLCVFWVVLALMNIF